MYLADVRLFRRSTLRFPEINSEQNCHYSSQNSQPSQDEAGKSHASAGNAKRVPANLAKSEIAEDNGGDGAWAEREDGAHETGNGEPACGARGENDRGRIGVQCGIEAWVKPALAGEALERIFGDLRRAIGARLHNHTRISQEVDYIGGLSAVAPLSASNRTMLVSSI